MRVVLVVVLVEDSQGPGVGVDAGEHLVVLEPELDRAVAAHRQPADRPAGTLGLHRERPIDQADDVLDQVVLVGVAGLGVGVPAPAAVGHDHDQGQALDVALDAGPPHPDRVVVGQAVQQVKTDHGLGIAGSSGKTTLTDEAF